MFKTWTVLYVEDDKNTQEFMKIILNERVKGFFQAFDGEEGLNMYKKHMPDIVLIDLELPKLNGLELIKQIKNIRDSQPVFIVSAYDDKEKLFKAIRLGVEGFIKKPIDIELLFDGLKEVSDKLQNRRKKEQEINFLYQQAHYDQLTEIPNRHLFHIKLDDAIRRALNTDTKIALFFIDLDDFKTVNDSYGHLTGDTVLKKVAEEIKKAIRSVDVVGRMGGDEFIVMIESFRDKNSLDMMAGRILERVRNIRLENAGIKIGCSIGISVFPDDGNNKNELLQLADKAMYQVKKTEKGQYRYISDIVRDYKI